jgi:multiple sugar transport system ATP-binding protein
MELESILQKLPSELSGGQAQRAGLARALVREPAVFLLDEPISHLDTRQRYRMRQFIKHIHMELGYTMIYVTHDQEEAMALADRIVVMHEGAIRQIGTPDEVYNYPADDFVAGFVGEPPMNFIEGAVAKQNGKLAFQALGQTFVLPENWQASGGKLPERVKLGIRPFYIDASLDPTAGHDLVGEVFLSENLQDQCVVSVDISDLRLSVVTTPGFQPARHERIYLKFAPAYIRFFDLQTGKAIRPDSG